MPYDSVPRVESIAWGTICLQTFPMHTQGDFYRHHCKDFPVTIFIKPPKGLEPYFNELSARCPVNPNDENDDLVYMPCAIGKCRDPKQSYNEANLLAAPGITEKSELFALDLTVPLIKIHDYVGELPSPEDLIVLSEYLGEQRFLAHPPSLDKLIRMPNLEQVEFQGVIEQRSGEGRKYPRVWLDVYHCSLYKPEISAQNKEALDRLKALNRSENSKKRFWWNIKLEQLQRPFHWNPKT